MYVCLSCAVDGLLYAIVSSRVVLNCSLALPVVWYKNNIPVPNSSRQTINPDTGDLTFEPVLLTQAGWYSCASTGPIRAEEDHVLIVGCTCHCVSVCVTVCQCVSLCVTVLMLLLLMFSCSICCWECSTVVYCCWYSCCPGLSRVWLPTTTGHLEGCESTPTPPHSHTHTHSSPHTHTPPHSYTGAW